MCDCIQRIEDKVKNNFQKLCHECGNVKIKDAHFDNLYFDTEDNWKRKLSLPITVEYIRETKAGKMQTRHKVLI